MRNKVEFVQRQIHRQRSDKGVGFLPPLITLVCCNSILPKKTQNYANMSQRTIRIMYLRKSKKQTIHSFSIQQKRLITLSPVTNSISGI